MHSTTFIKKTDKKQWVQIDGEKIVLGRLLAYVSKRLQGKHLPNYTPHMHCGDYVIITNASKILCKESFKPYHTGYPGGLKKIIVNQETLNENPEKIILTIMRGMLPKTKLGNKMLTSLRIFKNKDHIHTAQNPLVIDFKSKNKKNTYNSIRR